MCVMLIQIRAGTGLKFTGSGRARVFDYGSGSGSGLAIFISEPVGLKNFAIKNSAISRIYKNLCARACSGFQKSPRALE